MKSMDNLQAAFAGESQANRKYLAFSKQAEKEGYTQVAKLFRAAAEAETVHAHAHLRVMGGVKDTLENLKTAIQGEGHEFKEMYPEFIQQAKQEGNRAAETSFANASTVEEIHHGLFNQARKAVEAGSDLPKEQLYVCPVCGNTVEGDPPDTCPICQAAGSKFYEIR